MNQAPGVTQGPVVSLRKGKSMKTARVSIPAAFWERFDRSMFLEKTRPTLRAALREAFGAAERVRAGQGVCLRVQLTLEQVRTLETYAGDVVVYFSRVRDKYQSRVFRDARTVLARLDAAAEGLSRVARHP